MGCAKSKPEEEQTSEVLHEVNVDIQDPPVNSSWHNEQSKGEGYVDNPALEDSHEISQVDAGPPGVVVTSDGKAFVRRSSGSSFKIKTQQPQELKKVESNASIGPRTDETCEVLPKLKKARGKRGSIAKSTGAEFDSVATRRASAALLGPGASGSSGVLNAEEKARFAELDAANIEAVKNVPQSKLKNDFDEAARDPQAQTEVINASPVPKTFELDAENIKAAKAKDQLKAIEFAKQREQQLREEEEATKQGYNKTAPTLDQSKAALEAAKERAKKNKFGVDELPVGFMNAEAKSSHIIVEPPPKLNPAGKLAIKKAHEDLASQMRIEKKAQMKVLGAAARDTKHHKKNAAVVKVDHQAAADAQAARALEEAEFADQFDARIAQAKEESRKAAEEERLQKENAQQEEARRKKMREDLKKSAAEARAKKKQEEEEAAAARAKEEEEARKRAVEEHRRKMDSDALLPELRGAKQ